MRGALFLLLFLSLPASAQESPADLLGSRDVEQRLAGVRAIAETGDPNAEELLLRALKDPDWEVVEGAVLALAKHGTPAVLDTVADLAVEGPVRRIRQAAAGTARALDAEGAAKRLGRRLRGDDMLAALDALAVVAHPVTADAIGKLLRRKEGEIVAAALRALGALRDAERIEDYAKLLRAEDVRVRAAAVDALVDTGVQAAVAPLRDGLKEPAMTAVMERRHVAGIRRLLLALPDDDQRNFAASLCARSLGMAGHAEGDARFARLLGSLGCKEAPVGRVNDFLDVLLGTGLGHAEEEVRRAAVHALGRLQLDAAYEKIAEVANTDTSPRVRFHALRAAVAIRGKEALGLALNRLRYDEHVSVREEAATMAGRLGQPEAVPALIRSLADTAWEVVTCAAVSLGRLRDAGGVGPLAALLEDKDWRKRGAGVAGLGRIRSHDAVPFLIEATRDREPAVAATAVEFLRHVSGRPLDATTKAWRDWWAEHGERFMFRDRDAEAREAKKYGYAPQPRDVYEDLDVVVLQTRRGGDNIQVLLDDYGIRHRIIRAASLKKAGLHPYALFVANCPGEIVDDDVEQLQWFVRAGGYLFASCWALTETVQRAFPDVVCKLPLKGQVIGTVLAEPVPVESPFLEGVFDGTTLPLYELEGSHLIELIDPERFEILIDSPETATRWGEGNLAGWFTVGHGVILDSANHFDLQGMRNAKLRGDRDRMAFAVDHLGYDYATLRRLQGEGVFVKQPTAIKRTRDLSTFRFITTFVRQKRLADEE